MARFKFGRPISLRWNGLLIEGPAETVFEIPDEFYEEFNQDIGTVEPTIQWLDSDEGSTLRARVTALESGGGGATLSSSTPLALGTAAVGTEAAASHGDHVHPTTGLALSGHNHDGSYATTAHNHSGVYEPVNTAILKTVVDAKGDLIVGTASDTVDRLPGSGTNGYVLTYDSAETTGLKWAAAPGSGGGASVGNATPLALGTASAGDDSTASREDHVHPTTGLSLSGHNHDAAYAPIGDSNRADIVFETCKNSSGATIAKGKVVYIDGADGTNPTIALADADTEATSSKTLGFTETSSSNGDQVNVITHGRITNIDTSGASTEGVAVWLSGTAGSYVFGSPPSEPAHAVYLGVVTKKNASTGEIFVKVQNGYELDELHDVSVASPTAGDVIQWATDGTTYMWRKKSLSDAGISETGHTHSYASTTHASTHGSGGSDQVTIAPSQVTGTAVVTSDSRLTDSRTPTAHASTHNAGGSDALAIDSAAATGSLRTLGTSATSAAAGNHTHSTYATSASPTFTGTVTTPLTTAGVVKTTSGGVLSSVATLANSDLTNSSITINGTSVSLGGTVSVSGSVISSTAQSALTNYALGTSDAGKFIQMTSGSANTVTVGTGLNTLADGSMIHIQQTGAGKTTVVASGTTVTATPSLGLRAQYSSATLIKIGGTGTNVWTLVGDLSV